MKGRICKCTKISGAVKREVQVDLLNPLKHGALNRAGRILKNELISALELFLIFAREVDIEDRA
ncbi:hypothetical protein D3C81_2060010 [compost metagenome]